jgi:hypothetical protein|tara:strand:+ start:1724 stop:1918 length:195 start_codon:yes stop_codon:yes gene_type:complete
MGFEPTTASYRLDVEARTTQENRLKNKKRPIAHEMSPLDFNLITPSTLLFILSHNQSAKYLVKS